MKRNPNHIPAHKADLLSKVIMIENKLETATDELFSSLYYYSLPVQSRIALDDFIAGFINPLLPAYEVAEFERKFGHLARWTANLKKFEERLAKL